MTSKALRALRTCNFKALANSLICWGFEGFILGFGIQEFVGCNRIDRLLYVYIGSVWGFQGSLYI